MTFFNKKILRFFFTLCSMLLFYNCQNETTVTAPESKKLEKYMEEGRDQSKSIEERKEYLSNAYNLVSSLPDNTFKIQKIQDISVEYYNLSDLENYKFLSKYALEFSRKNFDSLEIARYLSYIGIYYRRNKIDSAYKNFYEADKIYRLLDQNKNIDPTDYAFDHGKVLIDLAKLSRRVKDYSESEDLTIQAIKKFELSGDVSYLPLSYTNLGVTSKYLGHYEDAVLYYLKSIEYAKNTPKEMFYVVTGNNNIGTVYKSQKKYTKAKEYYNKGLLYTDFLSKNPKRKAFLLDNLGYVKFLSDKNDTSALDLFKQAYTIRDSIQDLNGITTNSLHLAEYYQSKENDSLASSFAKRAEKASTDLNNEELLQSYQLLSTILPSDQGIAYAQKYIQLNDSLIKEERLFQNKFARIKFETDQKEERIITIQHQNTTYLLGILLLLTAIGFAVFFFRQRTRYLHQQNKIVQFQASYETETRISKRLHDELGNDIFQVMMQYQHDPHDPQIKDKLNHTYNKARDISRENNEFETGEIYPEELSNMLKNYTQNGIQLVLVRFDAVDWIAMPETIKITIYRVLQELMTNMQKHSDANRVTFVFSNTEKTLSIKYSDNGVGMAEEKIKSSNGLHNTEKRIRAIGGTIIFDAEKDKGFTAEIEIPN